MSNLENHHTLCHESYSTRPRSCHGSRILIRDLILLLTARCVKLEGEILRLHACVDSPCWEEERWKGARSSPWYQWRGRWRPQHFPCSRPPAEATITKEENNIENQQRIIQQQKPSLPPRQFDRKTGLRGAAVCVCGGERRSHSTGCFLCHL